MSKLGTKISTAAVALLIFCWAGVCRAGAVRAPERVCDITADTAGSWEIRMKGMVAVLLAEATLGLMLGSAVFA